MSKGISNGKVYEDLRTVNDFAEEYAYGRDAQDNIIVEHYSVGGQIVGTQTVTITLGEFKATK